LNSTSSLQIGKVPTPWKYSWLIAAQPRTDAVELKTFLNVLSAHVRDFGAAEARMGSSLEFLRSKFKDQNQDDIKARPILKLHCGLDLRQ